MVLADEEQDSQHYVAYGDDHQAQEPKALSPASSNPGRIF